MIRLAHLVEQIPPSFQGTLNNEPLRVRLDSSAIMKLANGKTGTNMFAALAALKGKVIVAAERLADGGFVQRADGENTIFVSAIDFD